MKASALAGLFALIGMIEMNLSLQPLAADSSHRINTDASISGGQPTPNVSHGCLYWIGDPQPSAFRLYAPDGHLALAQSLPGRETAKLLNLSVGADGMTADRVIAVSWVDGMTSGIDLLDAAGKRKMSLATAPYEANFLDFASDGSLWTFGWESSASSGVAAKEYMTVGHFAHDG